MNYVPNFEVLIPNFFQSFIPFVTEKFLEGNMNITVLSIARTNAGNPKTGCCAPHKRARAFPASSTWVSKARKCLIGHREPKAVMFAYTPFLLL